MNRGINLLGTNQQTSRRTIPRKLFLLRTIAVGMLFTVSGGAILIFLLIALSPLPALQQQEQAARQTMSTYHPEIAKRILIQDRLQASETILAKRTRFDTVLSAITQRLPQEAAITALRMNRDEISVTVSSTSLAGLDTFLANMTFATEAKKDFAKIVMSNFFITEGTNTFQLTLVITPL